MSENTVSGLDAAEAFFASMTDDPTGATDVVEEERDSEVEGDEPEALDDGSDETPDDVEDADEADEAEADADDESNEEVDEAAEPLDENALVPVTINGKSERVPLKDVLAGYQQNTSFTQKSQALAEERKAFEAEREMIRQERAYYSEYLPFIAQIVAGPQTSQADLEYLRVNHPEQYTKAWIENEEAKQKRATLEAEQERLEHLAAVEQAQAFNAHVASEREKLLQARPEWKDPKVFSKAQKEMREFARTVLNYSEEEIKQTADARAVLALDLAMRAHRASTMKGEPAKSSARRVAPGSANATPRKPSAVDEAMKRQHNNGSISNTADALRHLI